MDEPRGVLVISSAKATLILRTLIGYGLGHESRGVTKAAVC